MILCVSMDLAIVVLLNAIHWGTFTGVMVAATGALISSGMLSLGKWTCGHVNQQGYYLPGLFDLSKQLGIDQPLVTLPPPESSHFQSPPITSKELTWPTSRACCCCSSAT